MVNKITTPPSQKAVIDKINELIDYKQDNLTSANAGTDIEITAGYTDSDVVVSGNNKLAIDESDIISLNYVKVDGATEQCKVLSGYTQVKYLESTGTQYIDTGIIPNSTTRVVAKIAFPDVFNTVLSWGSRSSGTYNTSLDQFYCGRTNRSMWYYSATTQTGIHAGISPNVFYDIDVENTLVTATATQSIYLFALNNLGTAATGSSSKIAKFKIYNNGVMVRNLIPCKRNSDNVLGMYDTVTGNFLTNAGTGTFTAGADVVPTPNNPVDIVCNNGAVKVNTNLCWTEYKDYQLSRTDGITVISAPDVNVSGMVDCRTIKSFKITTISPQGSFRIFKYGIDNTYIDASSTGSIGDIVTFGDNVGFFRIQYNYSNTGVGTENILIYNSEYDLNEIYTDGTVEQITDSLGNTANAEMLLAVGNYKDTQEVLTGTVSRNVGIKVLDGSEDWAYSPSWSDNTHKCFYATLDNIKQQTNSSNECLCSHFEWYSRDDLNAARTIIGGCISGYSLINPESGKSLTFRISSSAAESAADFKQYLADQYNAGTPVIIVYPLATATTETVTGQTLTLQNGSNIIEITQASIDTLTLEAEYTKRVGTGECTISFSNDTGYITSSALSGKQDTLISGTNIKTINNESLLGSGNINISGGGGGSVDIDNSSITENSSNKIQTVGVIDNRSGSTIKTWTGTKAQYNAITTKDSNTLYNITDDTDVTLSLLELLYPVGSIYIGTMNVCPLSALGVGTWQLVASDRVLQGAGQNTSVGDTVEAGLPNITGALGIGQGSTVAASSTGAFRDYENGTFWGLNTGGTGTRSKFNASLSNSIYGNSTTVQPPAYIVNIWERVS